MQIAYQARYLGFTLGPNASDNSWKDPATKFIQRAHAWSDRQLGLHCTITCYNVFALPVLTYVAQLRPPPPHILSIEDTALLHIAPGPNNWISKTDLIWLQHLTGHPRSASSLTITCKAAQARVRVWDPACADHQADPNTPLEWGQTDFAGAMPPHTTSTPTDDVRPNNLTTNSSFSKRANYLRRLITAPDQLYTRAYWRNWFDNSMLLALESNLEDIQS